MNTRRLVLIVSSVAALAVATLAGIGTGHSFGTSGPLWGQFDAPSAHAAHNPQTAYGPQVAIGGGTARAFVTQDAEGRPTALGVSLTAKALKHLPTHGNHEEHMTVLALPANVEHAPFDHISLDWNPQGHEPPGVYDKPHFDFHFYMVTEAERDAIIPTDPAFEEKAARAPATQHTPVRHVAVPDGAIPRMGAHWIDPTVPELNGQPFTATLIYGFWDGNMIFVEPMITTAYIESVKTMPGQMVRLDVPQPETFERPGYYPTAYSVRYDSDQDAYVITLEELRQHKGL